MQVIKTAYRKKPKVVWACQWFKDGDHPQVKLGKDKIHGWVETATGFHAVSPGGWIIETDKGEIHYCKPDVFEKTYEKVTD